MKVLYAAQISNNTFKDGKQKFVYETDACYNLCVGIINTLSEQNPDWTFLVLLPHERLGVDVYSHSDKFINKKRIQFITYGSPIGPGNTRYHFDYEFWQDMAKNYFVDIDVMINDQNTLTKNWNMLFNEVKLNIPIVSTNYFMDTPVSEKVPKKIRYYERQMESFINSDMTAHQSQANKAEAMTALNLLYKDSVAKEVESKATIWRTGLRASEVSKFKTDKRFDKITFYFGNRISDTANRYNNYHKYAQAIGVLQRDNTEEVKDIDFYLLNPTRKVTDKQLSDIKDWSNGKAIVMANDKDWNRKMYMQFIHKAHVSVNLFTNEVHGGVTHAEGMLANNIAIMPNVNNYKWKYEQTTADYPFLVEPFTDEDGSLTITADDLAEKMLLAIKVIRDMPQRHSEYCELNRQLAYDYESYENACIQIKKDLEYLVEHKQIK